MTKKLKNNFEEMVKFCYVNFCFFFLNNLFETYLDLLPRKKLKIRHSIKVKVIIVQNNGLPTSTS